MSDSPAHNFSKFVPGFDFLQSLTQGKSNPMPGPASWVAPTLDPKELDKRIEELKAVQFWLDQNATALKATIQALEVQKMTLATLQGMNMDMSAMSKAFQFPAAAAAASSAPTSATPSAALFTGPFASAFAKAATPAPSAPPPAPPPEPTPAPEAPKPAAKKTAAAPAVDPVQLWTSLTQQFQQIATSAMQEVSKQAAQHAAQQVDQQAKKSTSKTAPDAAKKGAAHASPQKPVAKKAVKKQASRR